MLRDISTLDEILKCLSGQRCWAAIAGKGTGSHVAFDLGNKIKRLKPLENPFLSEESKNFYGEFSIFLQDCAWRLEEAGRILCTSKSDNTEHGEMVNSVLRVIGRRLERVICQAPGQDLLCEFSDDVVLRVFCDCTSQEDGDNYIIFSPDKVVAVGAKGEVQVESRESRNI